MNDSTCHYFKSLQKYPHLPLVLCAEPQQYSLVTPPLGRHIETTKHVAECATGHGCQEPFHGDGGNEACGYSPYAANKELHNSKRCRLRSYLYQVKQHSRHFFNFS